MSMSYTYTIWVGWYYNNMSHTEINDLLNKLKSAEFVFQYIYHFDKEVGIGIVIKSSDAYDGVTNFNHLDLIAEMRKAYDIIHSLGLGDPWADGNLRCWEVVNCE